MATEYAQFPATNGERMRAHAVLFQRWNAALANYGIVSGMDPVRQSASAVMVSAGSYRNGTAASNNFTMQQITSIPTASAGKHRYDLIVFDCTDTTLKRIAGTEDTPTVETDFLENLNPKPPVLPNLKCILICILWIDENGIKSENHDTYCVAGVADLRTKVPIAHTQDTDQYLDYGGSNQVSAADAKDAVSKKHTQDTDQYLDYGGSNQVSAADAKDAVTKKHTQGTDQYLDYGGSNQISAAQAKSAYTNIDKHQYLDYGGSNQISAAQLKKFYKHELNFNLSGGGIAIATGLHGGIQVPFACTIKKVRLLSVDATSGSITVDVWKGTYSSPPTSGGSIGSWSISSGTKSETTGLSISLSSEDILYFNVSSVTSLKLVLMVLEVEV